MLGNETKQAEKKGKGRSRAERRGRCQQAASSHLLPAWGLGAPPELRLMGTMLNLGGDTRPHPPPERSRGCGAERECGGGGGLHPGGTGPSPRCPTETRLADVPPPTFRVMRGEVERAALRCGFGGCAMVTGIVQRGCGMR